MTNTKQIVYGPPISDKCPSIGSVLHACCHVCGIEQAELIDGNRRPRTVLCRALFAYCGRTMTHASPRELAERIFGEQRVGEDQRGRTRMTEISIRVHRNLDMPAVAFVGAWRVCRIQPEDAFKTLRQFVDEIREILGESMR